MLENLKQLLGINVADYDDRLKQIISTATSRLRTKLGGIEPPEELQYIIIEVSVKRYNRLGSEGLTSHTVEGESLSFSDNDFAEFSDDISAWLSQQEKATRGRLRFL